MKDLTANIFFFNRKVDNPADAYLQKVPLRNAFVFRDINSKGEDNTGKFSNLVKLAASKFRVSILTLPVGIQYVNYEITGNKITLPQQKNFGIALREGVNSFYAHDIDGFFNFHICTNIQYTMPYGCAGAFCISPNALYKPFNLFYLYLPQTGNNAFFLGASEKPLKGGFYLIPMYLSNGTMFYYLFPDDGEANSKIQQYYTDFKEIQGNRTKHWETAEILIYNDGLDILTCSKIQVS